MHLDFGMSSTEYIFTPHWIKITRFLVSKSDLALGDSIINIDGREK
jgi:hypothetical protein